MQQPPLRPVSEPPVRFAPLLPPAPGWGLFASLAAISALPLAIAAVIWLARSPAPAAPAKITYDRLPVIAMAPRALQTVSFYAPEAPPPPPPLPPAKPPFKSSRSSVKPSGLCARHGMRQVWYGATWRCRR